jgi:predicted PurR-regulated permease PerM
MEMVYFVLIAIALYAVSDWIVNLIERKRRERLEHRSILFFAIIFVLALLSFNGIQYLMQDDTVDGAVSTGSTRQD